MQSVSNEFKKMCKSNTPSGAIGRIRVIEDDITIAENTDIKDIQIEDKCYVNDKFIGTTVAKKVTVNLFNDDNVYDLENKEVEVSFGFQHYEQEQVYKGKKIQILDAKPIRPKISLHGESSQATRSGKNIFDINNAFNYGTVASLTTINNDGTITTTSNFSSLRDIGTQLFLEKNTDYTISLFVNSITSTGTRLVGVVEIIEYDANDNYISRLASSEIRNIGQINTFTFNSGNCEKWALVISGWYGSEYSGTLTYSNVQVEKGTVATEYEQYGEMPSPDFPSSIENIEGKNLFNHNYILDNLRDSSMNSNIKYTEITLLPNTDYTLSANCYTSEVASLFITLPNITPNSNTGGIMTLSPSRTIKTDNEGKLWIWVRVSGGNNIFPTKDDFESGKYWAQLEKGTKATPYIPFNSLAVKVTGKNLVSSITKAYISSSGVETPENNNLLSNFIKVTQNRSYIFASYYIDSRRMERQYQVAYFDKNKNFISRKTISYNTAFTITDNNVSYVRVWQDKDATQTLPDYLQLEEGTVATAYELYKEQIVYFPLSEGQKLIEGSYLADDGIHNVKGQFIFKGTENISMSKGGLTECENNYFGIASTNFISEISSPVICTHFINRRIWNLDQEGIMYEGSVNSNSLRIRANFASVDEFKSWLAEQYANGTPVIAEYKLLKEETIPYTKEQQEAWDNIKALNLYEGTNNIVSDAELVITLGEEEISYGNFIIEKPDTEEVQATTRFVGYDYMVKFNKEFVDNNTYPLKLGTYFSNLCFQVGLVAGNMDFTNSDYMVQGNPFTNNEDCRTVLSAIAQIAGGIAKIGRDNKVYITNLSLEDAVENIDGNNYDTFTPNKAFGPINKLILKMNSGVDGEETVRSDGESINQNGEYAITISDNPILNSVEQRELVIDNIFNKIKGITYLPYKTTYYGYPYVDSTDLIKISNVNDTEYGSYIFNHILKYDGAFSGNIETSALTKTQSMYKNTLDLKTRFKKTELAVDKINGEIISIIEVQDEEKKKINSIKQDLDSTTARIEKVEGETSQINELKETIDGLSNTLTNKGGNNIFYYDEAYWSSEENFNIEEFSGTEIQQNSVSGMGYIINEGNASQIANVQNGTYTVSFKYKKVGPELASASVKINDKEYPLTEVGWTDFSEVVEVKSNHITVEFLSDTDNTLYVVDLLGNVGSEKEIWTQNPNEVRTDTVKIGRGIEVRSSEKNTYHRIDADGNRTYNIATGKVVNEATDRGSEMEELVVRGQAQISGLLIKQVRRPNVALKFIIIA